MKESSHSESPFVFPFRSLTHSCSGLFPIWLFCLSLPLLGEAPSDPLESLLETSLSQTGIPFLALVVDSPSRKGIYKRGSFVMESSLAFKDDTPLDLGNFNDLFLRLWFFRMEALGKLQLQTPLARYFPNESVLSIPPEITLEDLLNSQTGLSFREDRSLWIGDSPVGSWAELSSSEQRFRLERGDRSERTVFESLLLREVVTLISKESYGNTLQKDLWNPLGLSSFTFLPQKAKQRGWVSYSYSFLGLHAQPLSTRNHFLHPILHVFGKLEDIPKLMSVLIDPKNSFLTPEQKNRFFKPKTYYKNSEEKNHSFGFLKHSRVQGDFFLFSFGGEGSSGSLLISPSNKTALFLSTNSQSHPAIESIAKNLMNVLHPGQQDWDHSQIDERVYSLLGVSLLIVSLLLLISNAVIVVRVISKPSIREPKTVLLGKFLISLGSFLGLVWFRFLILPNLDSFSSITVRFASNSFHGWKPELYYGFLSLLITSFLYVLIYTLAISKYNSQITTGPNQKNATNHS